MVDLEGRSPLHVAVAAGKEKVVIYLNSLDRLSATIQDAFGRTPLHWAAYMGHSRIITQLMKQRGALQFQILDSNGASALQYCAYQGHVDAVRALLVFSDVSDIPDMNGRTALIVGAMLGSEDIVDMLAKSEKVFDRFCFMPLAFLHIINRWEVELIAFQLYLKQVV